MGDDAQALEVFDGLLAEATVARDPDAALRLFAPDADVRLWGSDEAERAEGREAIRVLLAAIASSEATLSFRWDDRHVHVEGEVAWVAASGEARADRGGQVFAIPYRALVVLVRRDGAWRIHSFCGAEPRPGG